ncbi:MAG: LysR substrate-binding domain-containing protein, partial [Gammaproteobacteria bacterium]
RRTVKVYPRLSVNNLDIIRDAAIAGMGVCRLPSRLCVDQLEAGTLKSLLPEWSFTPINLNLVYPSSRLLPTKTRAFIDFAVGLFRDYGMAYLTENRPRPS